MPSVLAVGDTVVTLVCAFVEVVTKINFKISVSRAIGFF